MRAADMAHASGHEEEERIMDHWHDLHSCSKRYREEALREARKRYVLEETRAKRSPRFQKASADPTWATLPSLLQGVGSRNKPGF